MKTLWIALLMSLLATASNAADYIVDNSKQANLIVFNNSAARAAGTYYRIYVDDSYIGKLKANGQYALKLPPGRHTLVSNDTRGIGRPLLDDSESYGSSGALQSYINMSSLSFYPPQPDEVAFGSRTSVERVAELSAMRWGAWVSYDVGSVSPSRALLGDDRGHWSFYLDSSASVLGGHAFQDLGNGGYLSVEATARPSFPALAKKETRQPCCPTTDSCSRTGPGSTRTPTAHPAWRSPGAS